MSHISSSASAGFTRKINKEGTQIAKMNTWTIIMLVCLFWVGIFAQNVEKSEELDDSFGTETNSHLADASAVHPRSKRTLFLKKKIIGAGLLGLGLGLAKGYKYGYHHGPEVHHVYLSPPPPPVRYVEYVEKPVYIEKIVERPVIKPAHIEYDPHPWSPPEPSPVYGSW